MIDTHQELVLALSEAAELEHNLICQYLFAAYSLRVDPAQDGITSSEAALFGAWQEKVLTVARQEMGHLGTVWNLAAVIGAAANPERANFPQAASAYYPPRIGFVLERFGKDALSRFIEFERPEPHSAAFKAAAAPDPLRYSGVANLYRQIRSCVASLPDEELLLNDRAQQDDSSWSNNVTLKVASNREQMLTAVDFIIAQGEGAPGASQGSHFATFSEIGTQLAAHLQNRRPDPARPCVTNPATQRHRDESGAQVIDHPLTTRAVDLFNLYYGTLLHLLRQYYAFAGETEDQRVFLRNASYQLMHACMAPLGRILSLMPAWNAGDTGTAGPSFELYGHEHLLTAPAIAWATLARRVRNAQREALGLAKLSPRFAAVFSQTANGAGVVAELLEQGLST